MFEVLYKHDAEGFDSFEFILRPDLQDRQDTICVANPVNPVDPV